MLFVHIFDTEERKANEPVIEVPPAIYNRMISLSNVVIDSVWSNYGATVNGIKIIDVGNKHYFSFTKDKNKTDTARYYYSFYLLKDI